MTVFENVVVAAAFGGGEREAAVYDAAPNCSSRCGLADKANKRAGGLTLLDRKRLELARALATRPRVLLLDEVAGGLTEHECGALVALIKDVRAERRVDRVDRARGACAARHRRPAGWCCMAAASSPRAIRADQSRRWRNLHGDRRRGCPRHCESRTSGESRRRCLSPARCACDAGRRRHA